MKVNILISKTVIRNRDIEVNYSLIFGTKKEKGWCPLNMKLSELLSHSGRNNEKNTADCYYSNMTIIESL